MSTVDTPAFADLLARAVSEPGVISQAYSQFHQYSIGNQLLAMGQCLARGIAPGPMATFPKWKDLGRYVRKGEKAITLCQPITIKRTAEGVETTDEPDVIVDQDGRFYGRLTLNQYHRQATGDSRLLAWLAGVCAD